MLHETRIQHLAEVAPHAVKWTEDRGWMAVVPKGYAVSACMKEIDSLTEDWATANGFTYDNIIASPEVACHPGSGYVEGLKLPKGWVTS